MERDDFNENVLKNWDLQDALVQLRLGSTKGLSRIFDRYYLSVCGYANSIIDNAEVSREIVSDVFFTVWKKRDQFLTGKELESFIFKCVKNASISHLRAEKTKKTREKVAVRIYADPEDASDTEKITQEDIEAFYAEINHLPPQQKQVIEMYLIGKTTFEISKVLNITSKTALNYKLKALESIQSKLSRKILRTNMTILFLLSLFMLPRL